MSLAALAEALAIAGVHEGFPVERQRLAGELFADGVTASDVDLLAEHCRRTVDGVPSQIRVLASILSDPAKREARLADLRPIVEARAKTARPFGDAAYVPGPTQGEPREVWDHDRQCRLAWCRVHGDRASTAVVAREMGVSESTLGVMLDRGRTLSRSPLIDGRPAPAKPSEIAAADADERARREQFREQMRNARQRAEATT